MVESAHLYHDIYRCESCSSLSDPQGVAPFANLGAEQTIPVSHFGNIDESLIWVVFNNPKGDRTDPNAGATPKKFGASRRSTLSDSDVQRIKEHFDNYFKKGNASHIFFEKWKTMLDGIMINGKRVTFENGGICAVDLIKCPTASSFMGFVTLPEGQKVWDNCLRDPNANEFLLRQIEYHRPEIIIFAGTQNCVKKAWKGGKNRELSEYFGNQDSSLGKAVWTIKSPRRLSLGLRNQRNIGLYEEELLNNEQNTIQSIIDRWGSMS